MAIIKRPFRIKKADGSWEEHRFPTSEDMIVDAMQSITDSGTWRMLPPDNQGRKYIVQTGEGYVRISRTADGSYWGEATINFPVQFPNKCIYAHAETRDAKTFNTAAYGVNGSMLKGFKPQFTSFSGTNSNFMWIAIGY